MVKEVRLALIGSNGMLSRKLSEQAPSEFRLAGYDLPDFDLTDRTLVLKEMARLRPSVIVNCAAYNRVDDAESEEEVATRVNGLGPGFLAEAAIETGALLVHFSTDYVFDGRKGSPYTEEDTPNPLSAYGRSKLKGEEAILNSGLDRFFIIRTSWLYGPGGKNFVDVISRLAAVQEELRIVNDQMGTPTYTEDLAAAVFDLIQISMANSRPNSRQNIHGIYHLSNEGQCSWYEFAKEIVRHLHASGNSATVKRVVPICTNDYPLPAKRPAYSVFSKGKYLRVASAEIASWQDGLKRYFNSLCS